LKNNLKIGVIGGGSWATAIVKILQEKPNELYWWLRSEDQISFIKENNHNPKYLSSATINVSKVLLTPKLDTILDRCDVIIVAIPSEFIYDTFLNINKTKLKNKILVSAVKGIIPQLNLLPALYFKNEFSLTFDSVAVISGPCHAEEVAMEKLSFLTFACENLETANFLAELFSTKYINSQSSNDMLGIELSSVLKNVYAISAGICHGLGYGDNFISVLISNCIKELEVFLTVLYPSIRRVNSTEYLGDLLVTSYSLHSRNRRFGNLIGRGYSVKAAKNEMNMIAEGYYASKCIQEINKKHKIDAPISDAVFQVLHCSQSPKLVFKDLSTVIR
jgi:glycerol-3-phosphate dehydrogenase (NAD(P)+)